MVPPAENSSPPPLDKFDLADDIPLQDLEVVLVEDLLHALVFASLLRLVVLDVVLQILRGADISRSLLADKFGIA